MYSSPSYSGVTNEKGEYDYKEGEIVTFTLGGITLGSVNAKTEVNVTKLKNGVAIARLLQSLDTDDNEALIDVSDIKIPAEIEALLIKVIVESEGVLDDVFTQSAMDSIETESEVTLVQEDPVTVAEAITHISVNVTASITQDDINNQAFINSDGSFANVFFDTGESLEYDVTDEQNVRTKEASWKLENGKLLIDYFDSNNTIIESITVTKSAVEGNKYTFIVEEPKESFVSTNYRSLPLSITDLDGKILSWLDDDKCTQRTINFTDNTAVLKEICNGQFFQQNLSLTTHPTINNVLLVSGTDSDHGGVFEVKMALYNGKVSDGKYVFVDDDEIETATLKEVDAEVSMSDATDPPLFILIWYQVKSTLKKMEMLRQYPQTLGFVSMQAEIK